MWSKKGTVRSVPSVPRVVGRSEGEIKKSFLKIGGFL